jgi:hypothetical protein
MSEKTGNYFFVCVVARRSRKTADNNCFRKKTFFPSLYLSLVPFFKCEIVTLFRSFVLLCREKWFPVSFVFFCACVPVVIVSPSASDPRRSALRSP